MKRMVRGIAVAGLLASGVGLAGIPAYAADQSTGDSSYGTLAVRKTVCADDLYVRVAPGGAWMGVLFRGQTFDVKEDHGDWVYGFAYGDVNKHGWVQDGWFC